MDRSRSLRVDDATIKAILDQLDQLDSQESSARRGARTRYSYRVRALSVEAQVSGAHAVRHVVPTRNISRDGITFLIGTLLYPGTTCTFQLITARNYWQTVPGYVTRCRYVSGTPSVYDTQARFLRPIDVALFSTEATPPQDPRGRRQPDRALSDRRITLGGLSRSHLC